MGLGGGLQGLATGNPILFIFLALGGVLLFALLIGLAIVVGFVILLLVGLFLPFFILVFGIWKMAQGDIRLGSVLVITAIVIWFVVYNGWVKFT